MTHPAIRKEAVAIVTGAAVGIGFAIAEKLLQQGMKVVMFDLNAEKLSTAIKRITASQPHAQIKAVIGDVCSSESLNELYKSAIEFGDVALIVNNAGIGQRANPWQNLENWQTTMNVNFWSIVQIQALFMAHLIEKGLPAAIVNLGSKEGITTPPGNAAYSVSKAALKVLTEQLAHELRQLANNQISAHLLIPGYTFTPMNFPNMEHDSKKPDAPWSADQVADRMLEGMANGDFYLFCEDNEVTRELDQIRMQWSADDLIKNRPALSRWHPEYKDEFNALISKLK